MQTTPDATDNRYNGLQEHTKGLPADVYFDPRHYERELQRIWYRNWVYVGRSSDVQRPRSFRAFELGDQKLLLVRDDAGELQGFHNTCRHRGAALCRDNEGVLRSGSIICPYHAWTYNLQGDLLRTSSKRHADGFDVANFPLYKIRVHEWRGFVFAALADIPPPFDRSFRSGGACRASSGRSGQSPCRAVPARHERDCVQRGSRQGAHAECAHG
jgi:glycine betaine catabolism A